MSESSQTSQADLCYVKRCSCVVFPWKHREKTWQTGTKVNPHPPPPSVPPNDVKRVLAVFCHLAQSVHISCIQIQHFVRREEQWGGRGGGRTLGLFVKSFLPALREKTTQEHLFTWHGRLAKFGWILTGLKISLEMAVTWFLPAAIQLLLRWISHM